MVKVQDVLGEGLVEKLGLAVRELYDEAGVLGLVPDGRPVAVGEVHGVEPNDARDLDREGR
jgi:hypothetical protein